MTGLSLHIQQQQKKYGLATVNHPTIATKTAEMMLLGPNTKPGRPLIALTEGSSPWTGVNGAFEVTVDPVP